MDSLIAAAARALAVGDALAALKRVGLRDDPPALALRGIAMAQLGEHPRARELLRRAARGFGAHEELARARCVVAEAEVALAMRDLRGSPRTLAAASATLEARADHANALQARLIAVRRLLLLGRLDEAASALASVGAGPLPSRLTAPSRGSERSERGGGFPDARGLPPSLLAVAELAAAEVALRSLRIAPAQAALARAFEAAERARVPALVAEVAEARAALDRPAARRIHAGHEQPLRLDEVEALLASGALVVDACRRGLRAGATWRPLARRPVLFALARALAEAWPGDVDRNALIARAFRTRRPDESHRARLRVEIGRLRALAAPLARIEATRARLRARRRAASAPSSCWRRPSMAIRRRCWRCSPTARRGPPRRSRWPSGTASAPSSARSSSWRPPDGCARSGARARSAGCRRRWPDSRRSCYSPLRCRSGRLVSRRHSEARRKGARQ